MTDELFNAVAVEFGGGAMWLLTGMLGLLAAGLSAGHAGEGDAPPDEPEDALYPLSGDAVMAGTVVPESLLDGPESAPPRGHGAEILWGDLADDLITGHAGDDQINGYDGSDTIKGAAGDDSLWGGAGEDSLSGGAGSDKLHGEDGEDRLDGGAGDDWVAGGSGDDTLWGGAGDDSLIGGMGDDLLSGGAGDDTLSGGLSDDRLIGGAGRDELFGDGGDDVLDGVSGEAASGATDFLNGGDGSDWLLAGSGDWMHGGAGNDLFALAGDIDPDAPATIQDFEKGADRIAVLYDPHETAEPEITLEPSESREGVVWIALDGVRIAEVHDAPDLTLADITLLTAAEFALL